MQMHSGSHLQVREAVEAIETAASGSEGEGVEGGRSVDGMWDL